MFRRNRYVRPLLIALGSAVVVGAVAGGYKQYGHPQRHALASDVTPPGGPVAPSPLKPSLAPTPFAMPAAGPTKPAGKPSRVVPAVYFDSPTTRPGNMTLAPSTRPAKTGPVDGETLFKDVDAKIAADDYLAARDALVQAMDAKTFGPAETEAALDRLQKINDVVVFSPRKFNSDPGQLAYSVASGDNLQKIANKFQVTVGFLLRINGMSDPRRLRLGQSLKVVKGPFSAEVNKTTFVLDLYQGQPGTSGAVFLRRLRVGLGENDSTPTGLWKIGDKLVNPVYYNSRDTGPRIIAADDPKNPLGERYLALVGTQGQSVGKEGYAIHGTIDPASIGQKKSLGCIRLLNEDINLVYDMLIKEKSSVTVIE